MLTRDMLQMLRMLKLKPAKRRMRWMNLQILQKAV